MSLAHLQALASRYPNVRAALAEIAGLEADLALPTPTVHVVSDVHGEYSKLRHVIHNASGSLRPQLQQLFGDRLTHAELDDLLATFYYPRETWIVQGGDEATRRARLLAFLPRAVEVIRVLARRYTLEYVAKIVPDPFDAMFRELLFADEQQRPAGFVESLVDPFLRYGRDQELVRVIARVVRNLSVGELIVAGDLGDRGPRIDKVIELVMQQPNASITWGNHDAEWMAACLGVPAAIMTVIRVSLRYRRLSQLEEGYGIPMAPLERLAREAYGEDPCARFQCKGEGLRDDRLMARMQKAAAILQFKLEGELFRRRTDWEMTERALLHRIDPAAGTVTIDGKTYPMLDTALPTIDWADPYKLSAGEAACLERLTRSFMESGSLWRQMSFVVGHGQMMIRRDRCAIFHGCIPVDAAGAPLPFAIDGALYAGKALLTAFDHVVQRAFRKRELADAELIFYLWTGARSPCFGKDKMATFETYFVADKAAAEEHKNPYFKLLDDPAFCARMLRDLGVDDEHGFIINGHVPVKLEKGETPLKKSGRAITIDGAFAAAYGDKGFSLVLDAQRMYLAQHSHFDGVDAAVEQHADMVPTVTEIVAYDRPRTVGDTEQGDAIRGEIIALEELIDAFEDNVVRETGAPLAMND